MKKILLLMVMGMFLFSMVSALEIPIYNINQDVNISVTCINGELSVCSNESVCNINIFNPNGGILINGENMTNNNNYHYLTINTDDKGMYLVNGYCIDNGFISPIEFNFELEDRDKEFTLNLNNISDRIVLLILLFISTVLLIFNDTRVYGGIGYAIGGLMLMFSGINFIVSILILCLGLFMSVFSSK